MENEELQKAVLESVKTVQRMGYTVLYAANYGSHNYNLDINNDEYQSDIDTKIIILPTLEELVNNSKPISTTIDISTGQCDIKDIRAFVPTLLKANIQFLELLCAKSYWINPLYEEDFNWFISNLEELVKNSKSQLLKSIHGMSLEKRKALTHPYPTIKWKIDKWGYDGKQLHHIIRLKDFIDNYFFKQLSFKQSIQYEKESIERDILMKAKLNKMPLKQAQDYAEIYCGLIGRIVNDLLIEVKEDDKIKREYNQKTKEIIIKNIKKKILEDR